MISFHEFTRSGLLALMVCTACDASIITTPPGLTPGTQYQLAFITADGFAANVGAISTYNTDVSNEAASNATLAAFDTARGVTWAVIGSTTTVNANVNAPAFGLIFTLNGTQIASAANGLYSGSLLAPLDIDQNGNTLNTGVWTGSNSAGTAAGGINDLSQTFTEFGGSSLVTSGWIALNNGTFSNNNQSLYALSSVITVAGTSATPEPGTVALIPGAGLLFLCIGRRRRQKHA